MIAWTPTGPLLAFTGATSAPTSVQVVSRDKTQSQQVMVVNTDSSNDCVIGWGQNDAQAKYNAAASSDVVNCAYIQHSTTQVISIPNGSYVSGITGSSTAAMKVQCGIGN